MNGVLKSLFFDTVAIMVFAQMYAIVITWMFDDGFDWKYGFAISMLAVLSVFFIIRWVEDAKYIAELEDYYIEHDCKRESE